MNAHRDLDAFGSSIGTWVIVGLFVFALTALVMVLIEAIRENLAQRRIAGRANNVLDFRDMQMRRKAEERYWRERAKR